MKDLDQKRLKIIFNYRQSSTQMGPSHEIWHHGSRTSIILVCTPKSEQKDFVKASFSIMYGFLLHCQSAPSHAREAVFAGVH